jgi:hypothetical protein
MSLDPIIPKKTNRMANLRSEHGSQRGMGESSMFCPKCRSEYNEGVKVCAECEAPLVATLPEKPKHPVPNDIDFVTIVETFSPADIAIIESILEGSEIDYYIQGENALSVTPYVIPVRVLVTKEQVEKAKELLKDLDLTFKAISFPDREGADTDSEPSSEVENGEGET